MAGHRTLGFAGRFRVLFSAWVRLGLGNSKKLKPSGRFNLVFLRRSFGSSKLCPAYRTGNEVWSRHCIHRENGAF